MEEEWKLAVPAVPHGIQSGMNTRESSSCHSPVDLDLLVFSWKNIICIHLFKEDITPFFQAVHWLHLVAQYPLDDDDDDWFCSSCKSFYFMSFLVLSAFGQSIVIFNVVILLFACKQHCYKNSSPCSMH